MTFQRVRSSAGAANSSLNSAVVPWRLPAPAVPNAARIASAAASGRALMSGPATRPSACWRRRRAPRAARMSSRAMRRGIRSRLRLRRESGARGRLVHEPLDAAALGAPQARRAGIGLVDVERGSHAGVEQRAALREFPLATVRAAHGTAGHRKLRRIVGALEAGDARFYCFEKSAHLV